MPEILMDITKNWFDATKPNQRSDI